MTSISASDQSRKQKITLVAGDGHSFYRIMLGFMLSELHMDPRFYKTKSDDEINISTIHNLPAQLNSSNQVMGHWEGIRALRQLIICHWLGQLLTHRYFSKRFESLARDPNRWVASRG